MFTLKGLPGAGIWCSGAWMLFLMACWSTFSAPSRIQLSICLCGLSYWHCGAAILFAVMACINCLPTLDFPGEGVGLPPPGRCHIEVELEVLWAPLPLSVHAAFFHAFPWYDAVACTF